MKTQIIQFISKLKILAQEIINFIRQQIRDIKIDERKKITAALTAILIFFVLWFLLSSCLTGLKKAKPAEVTPAAAPAAPPTVEATTTEAEVEITVPTLEVKLIDPFSIRVPVVSRAEAPLPEASLSSEDKSKPAAPPPQPELEGIWIDPEMKVAFISGQAVRAGEKVLGWTVTLISKEKVYLQKGSATKILKLEEK